MDYKTSKQETVLDNVRITGHLHNAKIPQLSISQLVSETIADKELFDCITTEKVEQLSKAHNDLGFTIDRLKKFMNRPMRRVYERIDTHY